MDNEEEEAMKEKRIKVGEGRGGQESRGGSIIVEGGRLRGRRTDEGSKQERTQQVQEERWKRERQSSHRKPPYG
jgi:hypothetical protein